MGAPSASSGGATCLLFVRFGNGTESAIQTATGNLVMGSRVRVIGSGGDALVIAE